MTPAPKLFLTGEPGCGKTTVVQKVAARAAAVVPVRGFWTEDVRDEEGRRVGFRGVTVDGRTFPLAHVGLKGVHRVGPYGVTLEGLETTGIEAMSPGTDTRLVLVDEVGKMEAFSTRFRDALLHLLAGPTPVLGTVAMHGVGFVKQVRQDPRITLIRMHRRSREAMVGEILRRLESTGVLPAPRTGGRRAG